MIPPSSPFHRFPFWSLAAAAVVYALSWSPVVGIFGDHPFRVAVVVLLVFPVSVFLAWRFHTRYPRLGQLLALPYWLLLLGVHLIFMPFARGMAPAYFWLSLLTASAVLWLPFRRKTGPAVLLFSLLVLAVFAALDLRYHSALLAGAFLLALLLAVVVLRWLFRRAGSLQVSRFALAVAVFSVLIYPRSLLTYRFSYPGYLPRILSQPGVRTIYTYADREIRAKIPSQIMFLSRLRGTETYVLGPQKPFHQVLILHAGAPPHVETLELGSRGSDNLALDPKDPGVVYLGAGNRFLKIRTTPLAIVSSLELGRSFHNLNFVQYDARRDRFLLSQDMGRQVFVVDGKSMQMFGSIPSPGWSFTDDVWVDPVGDLVLVDCRYFVGRRVDTYDGKTLERRRTYFWPWDYGFNFGTLDVQGRRVYLASTNTGKVRILDLDNLTPVDEFRLEPGIRNLNFDVHRGWLLVGNYFRGDLIVYDPARGRVIGRIFLGRRLRWIEIDQENGSWYATTAVGGFKILPDEALR
jgi:hypothetical protein